MKSPTQSAIKLRELILLTLLGVLMYVLQVIMSQLPNIEPVTLFIILTARKFGYKSFLSVYVFVGCELMTYGLEMWALNYLYVWAVLCVIACLLRKVDSAAVWSLIAAIYGLFFGTLCAIPYFIIGGVSGGVAYMIGNFWFDILHCGGNFVLVLLLYAPLTRVMNKVIK